MVLIGLEFEGKALLGKLQRKADELPDKLAEVVNESAFNAQELLMIAAPRDTGNLESSHTVENKGLLGRTIFPDEGIAPYALYVVLGHRTRPFRKSHGQQSWVPANNYIKRSTPVIGAVVKENLEEFKQWLLSN